MARTVRPSMATPPSPRCKILQEPPSIVRELGRLPTLERPMRIVMSIGAPSLVAGVLLSVSPLRSVEAQSVTTTSADTATAPALGDARGAFMALSVPDLAASRRWYVEKLGLRPTLEIPPANGGAVVVLEGGGLIVELVQLDSAVARTRAPERTHGYFKSGVVVDDLPRVVELLRGRGVEIVYGPFPARDRVLANVIIRDNAGNLIQLFGR